MTDNEIIKALECCKDADCVNCPNWTEEWHSGMCSEFSSTVLDLINRQKAAIKWFREQRDSYMQDATDFSIEVDKQKAEIERLKAEAQMADGYADALEERAKAEAIKEFAERSEKDLFIKQDEHRKHWMETLNRHRGTEAYKDHEWSIDNWLRGYGEAVQDILGVFDNLVKEMTGEQNDKS